MSRNIEVRGILDGLFCPWAGGRQAIWGEYYGTIVLGFVYVPVFLLEIQWAILGGTTMGQYVWEHILGQYVGNMLWVNTFGKTCWADVFWYKNMSAF